MRDGWIETTLGDIVSVNPEAASDRSRDDEIIYVDLASVSAESGISDDLYQGTFGEAPGRARRVIRAEDVLVSTVRPYLRGFAQVPASLDGQIASTGFAVLRAKPKSVLPGFIWAIVGTHSFVDHLMDRATGSSYPAVRPDDVASFRLSLPSITEQNRIVDVVSAVDEYIAALQRHADAARTARNAVLHELLTTSGDDWVETTLGDVLEIARGGSPRPIHEYLTDEEDGVNWVKIGDASASTKYITTTAEKIRQKGVTRSRRVNSGDFILSNSMSFGRPYIMRTDGCIHDGWLLLSGVTKHFDEDFLYNLLLSDEVQRQFNSLAAGSGVRNLNIEVVSEVRISLPSRQTQIEIASLANLFDEHVNLTELAIDKAKSLRSGLLSDLLSGAHEIPASYDRLLGAA